MKEILVETRLKEKVIAAGGIIRKAIWAGRRGAPDRWVGFPSTRRSAWVELKRPKTPDAEAHQSREHERMRSCGEDVRVIANYADVDAFVREMTRTATPMCKVLMCSCGEDHVIRIGEPAHPHYIQWLMQQTDDIR